MAVDQELKKVYRRSKRGVFEELLERYNDPSKGKKVMLEDAPGIIASEISILSKQVAHSKNKEFGEKLIEYFKKQMKEAIRKISFPGWKGWKWVSALIGIGITLVIEATNGSFGYIIAICANGMRIAIKSNVQYWAGAALAAAVGWLAGWALQSIGSWLVDKYDVKCLLDKCDECLKFDDKKAEEFIKLAMKAEACAGA